MNRKLDRVLGWPVADPKQRIHLALAESWRVSGKALCGESIKGEAPNTPGDVCSKCAERATGFEAPS